MARALQFFMAFSVAAHVAFCDAAIPVCTRDVVQVFERADTKACAARFGSEVCPYDVVEAIAQTNVVECASDLGLWSWTDMSSANMSEVAEFCARTSCRLFLQSLTNAVKTPCTIRGFHVKAFMDTAQRVCQPTPSAPSATKPSDSIREPQSSRSTATTVIAVIGSVVVLGIIVVIIIVVVRRKRKLRKMSHADAATDESAAYAALPNAGPVEYKPVDTEGPVTPA